MLAFVFVRAYIDYGTKGYAEDFNYTAPWHGIEIPILIGIGGLLLGVVLMVFCWFAYPSSSSASPSRRARRPSRSRRSRPPSRWSRRAAARLLARMTSQLALRLLLLPLRGE